jgi:hypothetical protein
MTKKLDHYCFGCALRRIAFFALFAVFVHQPMVAQITTLNLSEDPVRYGIASINMLPDQPSVDAGPLVFAGITYALSHQISRVIADPGTYCFQSVHGNTHVDFGGLTNMTIDFQGADLIFSHPLYYGMVVCPSTNVTLENFAVDYQPLPFTLDPAVVDFPV